jgi:tRNA pseudouridine38-40 synthase
MPRFKLLIEYSGTRYSGWQVQKNARTVQGELIRAAAEATGRANLELYGAGRTDAGVHALGQVAHLDVATTLPPAALLSRVNDALPADIAVLSVEKTTHRFHARHDAVARSYVYQLATRRIAFGKPYVWWVRDPLALGRMQEAAGRLEGFHDFRSFSDDDPGEKSTEVLLESVRLAEAPPYVLIRVEGSHFLWKMVRRLVGVLVEIGRGAVPATAIDDLLGGPSPLPARLTAPASGLFLERVYYPGEPRDTRLRPPLDLRR